MREIKFRAWNPQSKEILNDVNILVCNDQCHGIDEDGIDWGFDFCKPILMQFTGLKDKNGVDIYEGDIVKAVSNQHYWLSVVSSENSGIEGNGLYAMEFCNNLTSTEFGDEWTFKNQSSTRRNTVNSRMEIIGNIFENKDLIEVNK